jgi:hypothetical protein
MVWVFSTLLNTSSWKLTVYQLLREVLPVMIPEMAPRPMGRPTLLYQRIFIEILEKTYRP